MSKNIPQWHERQVHQQGQQSRDMSERNCGSDKSEESVHLGVRIALEMAFDRRLDEIFQRYLYCKTVKICYGPWFRISNPGTGVA